MATRTITLVTWQLKGHMCVCTGSSTRHIVTFDGQNFKLTGSCSYVLFQNKEQDLEVILHNSACSPGARQGCMKSIQVKHSALSVELHSDMEVRSAFCGSRGKAIECQGNLVLLSGAQPSS
ncbi:hypothetical protein P7K49_040990 [Saguinus oedipus]|uniref:VWFD domain-containing protein n=1 Tax=Saguinus oedipus TaxID=9490 RepID=A0ABQ9T915_SAGOE|nr:hypothetical protein P7K49_040990 [Saguinus oedipus]